MNHRDLLKDAARVVTDRNLVYGEMAPHFERVAKLASLKLDREITVYEVLIIMESLKDARRAHDPRHYDSHVDGINYRAFAAEFAGAEAPINPKVPEFYRPKDGDYANAAPAAAVAYAPPRSRSDALKNAMNAVDQAVGGGGGQ
jgi:hypothetical protein